ncbi:MAG: hypothetical protein NTY12_03555 [Candidatus Falkowbacteria bacterium]|nr:hypothetical protein [Candidatus Falkowbacteria bacterium]
MKKQIALILGVIVIVAAGFYIWQTKSSAPITDDKSEVSEQRGIEEQGSKIPAQEPVVESKKLVKASLAEVSAHKSTTDCWAVVDKNIYDLTSWISKHPGGDKAIIGLCGIDGTAAFTRQHGSSDKAKAALASFLIGNLTE